MEATTQFFIARLGFLRSFASFASAIRSSHTIFASERSRVLGAPGPAARIRLGKGRPPRNAAVQGFPRDTGPLRDRPRATHIPSVLRSKNRLFVRSRITVACFLHLCLSKNKNTSRVDLGFLARRRSVAPEAGARARRKSVGFCVSVSFLFPRASVPCLRLCEEKTAEATRRGAFFTNTWVRGGKGACGLFGAQTSLYFARRPRPPLLPAAANAARGIANFIATTSGGEKNKRPRVVQGTKG